VCFLKSVVSTRFQINSCRKCRFANPICVHTTIIEERYVALASCVAYFTTLVLWVVDQSRDFLRKSFQKYFFQFLLYRPPSLYDPTLRRLQFTLGAKFFECSQTEFSKSQHFFRLFSKLETAYIQGIDNPRGPLQSRRVIDTLNISCFLTTLSFKFFK